MGEDEKDAGSKRSRDKLYSIVGWISRSAAVIVTVLAVVFNIQSAGHIEWAIVAGATLLVSMVVAYLWIRRDRQE
jgi:hypothetical protein